LYEMLKTLPIRATRAEIAEWLPEHRQTLEGIYQSHQEEAGGYRLRGVCLYGMAECERSRRALEFLRRGDIDGFGELIDLSHEGDRAFINNDQPFEPDISDAYLDRLIQMWESASTRDKSLYQQPGAYAASCQELDALVDLARQVEGVLGAGLIGAGLGGCISVLVRADAADELIDRLQHDYYDKQGFEPFMEVCAPVTGAGVMRIDG
jgi:N-acetylgalactosamine kinase